MSKYIVINSTQNTKIDIVGNWPSDYLEKLLNAGDKVIVISMYSLTIKVPYKITDEWNTYGEIVWDWEDYSIK